MERVTSKQGVVVSFDRYGSGPPLVLVHGSFSDHLTNWMLVRSRLAERFTVYAIARRGRGETAPSDAPSVEDEAADVAAVIEAVGARVFLLGHSYGAMCALEAAALVPERIAKLVLYEPPWPSILAADTGERLERLGTRDDWDALVETFLREVVLMPRDDLAALRHSPDWAMWTSQASATLPELRAAARYAFDPVRFHSLALPVLLLVGSESPRERYLTDALAATFRDSRVVVLEGAAHEGMTTAPDAFADAVERFLFEPPEALMDRARAPEPRA